MLFLQSEEPQINLVTITVNGTYECDLCEFQSTSFLDTLKHLEQEHNFDKEAIEFFCLQINFKPEQNLKSQRVLSAPVPVPKNFSCESCERKFPTYKGMRQHYGKVHSSRHKDKKCAICGSKFNHKYALKFHHRQVHETSTRVACILCNRVLYNKYHLKKHHSKCPMSSNSVWDI